MSQVLAHRFASKCFTPLELAHLKDNFFAHASDQDGLRYWTEETLSQFLGIPDGAGPRVGTTDDEDAPHIDAGPVIFRMVSYLGAFPFQNTMAPSVLTFDALVKVTVLLTERYGKVLRRGKKDRVKLLFGSLADVGRRDAREKVAGVEGKNEGENGETNGATNGHGSKDEAAAAERSHAQGFSVDKPANDGDDDDEDDDLALAALESLDAIEVFKHDHRIDRKMFEARISVETLRRLLMLLILIAPLKPQEAVSKYTTGLSRERIESVCSEADAILAGFSAEEMSGGITYDAFARIVTRSLPYLFDPLTPLFEHLLFSKNLDLSRKRRSTGHEDNTPTATQEQTAGPPSPPLSNVILPGSFEGTILTPSLLSHISFFLPTSSSIQNIFRDGSHLHPVFSTSAHGESLTSFEHHVMTWQAPTLLLLQGVSTSPNSSSTDGDLVTLGAYIPTPWKSPNAESSISASDPSSIPYLFQLSPVHTLLPGNAYNSSGTLPASFSTKDGIVLGCRFPPRTRSSITSRNQSPTPTGGGSLIIDHALEHAKFITSNAIDGGEGAFLPAVLPTSSSPYLPLPKTTKINLYGIEVWGLVPAPAEPVEYPPSPPSSHQRHHHRKTSSTNQPLDAIAQQRARWDFEAKEAERRRTINFKAGGDGEMQSARALLEMAGIIGDQGKSGGSV